MCQDPLPVVMKTKFIAFSLFQNNTLIYAFVQISIDFQL